MVNQLIDFETIAARFAGVYCCSSRQDETADDRGGMEPAKGHPPQCSDC